MQLLEHFKELSIYPKNAKQLKGLILQLAIQGKLTADWRLRHPELVSGSNSAKALLASIKAEKEQLIKDKKIKKEKPLPAITEEEIPYVLPEGWEWCRLGQVTDIIAGASFKSGDFNDIGGSKCIKITNAGVREFVETNDFLPENFVQLFPNYLIKEGDLILALTRPYIKDGLKISVCPLSYHDSLLNQRVASIRSMTEEIYHPYIFSFIQSPEVLIYYKSMFDGKSQQPNMKMGDITELMISIPPLAEQKAIVETVNTLFKEVEALEKLTLERISLKEDFITSALRELSTGDTPKEWAYLQKHFLAFMNEERNIKKLRETILQLAVQGKLTANWRTCHPELAEGSLSAKALLASIKAEKEQLIKDKKIKKEKPLPAITEDEKPYDLPEGWEWCRLGDLVTFLNGYAFKSSTYVPSSKHQVIRLGNVKNDNFLIDTKEAYVPKTVGEDAIAYQLSTSDILTTLTGTKDKRDYCYTCLVKPEHLENRVLLLNQRVGCIRAIDKGASELLNKFLKADAILDQLFATETGTANQGNIGSTAFKNLVFPLPPLAEQKAIVEKVNSLMALCNELETAVVASKANAEMLMQSVLREVFEKKAECAV